MISSELPDEELLNHEAHTRMALTDATAVATPKGDKSSVSAASKPPAPLLQQSFVNTVVLGLAGPADEYQVMTLD